MRRFRNTFSRATVHKTREQVTEKIARHHILAGVLQEDAIYAQKELQPLGVEGAPLKVIHSSRTKQIA
jgi:hypothetical protein